MNVTRRLLTVGFALLMLGLVPGIFAQEEAESEGSTNPLWVVPHSILYMTDGSLAYPQERVGETITLEDGRDYLIFREVYMRDDPPQETGGVFRVWFYAETSPEETIIMSNLTKLFFVGMLGFRSKTWLLNTETGEFGGIYQFDTVEHARGYAHSFAMMLSRMRSLPGMFRVEVYAKEGEDSLYRAQSSPMEVPD